MNEVAYQQKIYMFISKTFGDDVKHIVEFTDGCSSQFRSRHTTLDLSYARKDFGVNIQRLYFETSHGKGPSDGEGRVKKVL